MISPASFNFYQDMLAEVMSAFPSLQDDWEELVMRLLIEQSENEQK